MMPAGRSIPSIEEWLDEDDSPQSAIETPAQTIARHKRAERLAAQAIGSSRPVDSGQSMLPQLRVRKRKGK